ncbi:MAG: OmpA family protein [Proteobacteria bacterium]|nr:OmpA family protein [Pseudomonadota bacterium]
MKRILLGTALCALGAAHAALAADDTGAWYISPMAQWTLLNQHRTAEDGAGFQVGLGWNVAENWAMEAAISQASFEASNGGQLKLSQYSLDFIRKFSPLPESHIKPYLLFGLGGMDDRLTGASRASGLIGEVGAGLLWNLGPFNTSQRLAIRTEAKYRRYDGTTPSGMSNAGDTIFGVGLQYMWGLPVAAAPTPPPAPPPPPPPPAPPADSDHDGVPDTIDQCPNTPPGVKVDAKGCELDSDGDGVPDSRDLCPNTPKGDRVDVHGCTIKGEISLPRVHFATDSAVLTADSSAELDDAVATLKKNPDLVIEVRGHTDSTGTKRHNQILSQKRAESVEAYLKEHGVTNKLTARGFGQSEPIADNKTEEGRQKNRRVTLKLESGN